MTTQEGLEQFKVSKEAGCAWMRHQFHNHPKPDASNTARKRRVYTGEYSFKWKMLTLIDDDETGEYAGLREVISGVYLKTNDASACQDVGRDHRQRTRELQRSGRLQIVGNEFVQKVTTMAIDALASDPCKETIFTLVLCLLFSLSLRINEADPANSKRRDRHVANVDDFELIDWICVQKNGSKWKDKDKNNVTRDKNQVVCLLDPALTQQIIDTVYSWTPKGGWPKSEDASKWFTRCPCQKPHTDENGKVTRTGIGHDCGFSECNGSCDGSNRFAHILRKHGLDTCIEAVHTDSNGKRKSVTPNHFRAASLTMLPLIHDVSACGAGKVAPIKYATSAQAGHVEESDVYEQYINNHVSDQPVPNKRVKYTKDVGLELA